MSLNSTPLASRVHIAFLGCRNAGKSSLVNSVTGQSLSVVSDVLGTTTDPVSKTMELLPIGPVVIIDTAGIDDIGELGKKRIKKTLDVLDRTDVAVLVADATIGLNEYDKELERRFKEKNIPYIICYNKCDLKKVETRENEICVSAKTGENVTKLKEMLGKLSLSSATEKFIVADLIDKEDLVILVTPIDEAAPKGRIILPQQMTLREILDKGAVSLVTKETELSAALKYCATKPKLVITDSQVFGTVSKIVPPDIALTSFSVLMARYKGFLYESLKAVKAIEKLKENSTVLIAEGCTHHRQCGDIGSVKIPAWLKKHTGENINIELSSGNDFPSDLSRYSLVIHCGGCMLNESAVLSRMKLSQNANVPFINYGILIAYMNGILERATNFLK